MSRNDAVTLLKSKGYDAELSDKLVKVYYSDGLSIFDEVGEILMAAGYIGSYETCGRYDKGEG